MNRDRWTDRGSAAVEMAIVAPVLLLMLMLVIYAGRATDAQQQVQSAAHAAARAASQHNDPAAAVAAARDAAHRNLTDGGITCLNSQVTVATGNLVPNGSVTVTVECNVRAGDLAMLRVSSLGRHFQATVTEVVDRYRGEG